MSIEECLDLHSHIIIKIKEDNISAHDSIVALSLTLASVIHAIGDTPENRVKAFTTISRVVTDALSSHKESAT